MIENKLKANRPARRGFLSTLFQRKKTQMTLPYRFVEFRMHVSDRTLARFVFNADAQCESFARGHSQIFSYGTQRCADWILVGVKAKNSTKVSPIGSLNLKKFEKTHSVFSEKI